MSGYLKFDMTGCEPIDNVLRMVEAAGDGCHHTEDWHEFDYIQQINETAKESAEMIRLAAGFRRDPGWIAEREAMQAQHAALCVALDEIGGASRHYSGTCRWCGVDVETMHEETCPASIAYAALAQTRSPATDDNDKAREGMAP
jgi:hypothetical protein